MKRMLLAAMVAGALGAGSDALAHGGAPDTHGGAAPAVEETPFGRAGDASKVDRTVEVRMTDAMRFEPDVIRVRAGETVRIVARDVGHVPHEFVLGTMSELREHAELMRKFPNMEHDEPNMAHAKSGDSAAIVWQFTRPGQFHFACLVPGHLEAGMIGKVIVTAR